MVQPEAEVADVEELLEITLLLGRQYALHKDPLKVGILSNFNFNHFYYF